MTKLPLEDTCLRVIEWLEGMAGALEKEAGGYSQYPSLGDNCRADAKNFRATANSIRKDIEKAKKQ